MIPIVRGNANVVFGNRMANFCVLCPFHLSLTSSLAIPEPHYTQEILLPDEAPEFSNCDFSFLWFNSTVAVSDENLQSQLL
jgi:hypothetical protein